MPAALRPCHVITPAAPPRHPSLQPTQPQVLPVPTAVKKLIMATWPTWAESAQSPQWAPPLGRAPKQARPLRALRAFCSPCTASTRCRP
eukprot:1159817-Pelagomonas_calceolata.AAC.9